MTSGTITDDKTVKTSTDWGGANTVTGSKSTKTWSGADDTSVKIKYPRSPPTAYYVWKTNKRGQTYRVLHYHRGKPARPPKRARGRGEHAYNMSLTSSTEPVITWQRKSDLSTGTGTIATGFGGVLADDPWTANDDIKLIQKLREKLSGANFDMSVFLGTSHQSLHTIAEAATKIAEALKHLRKGNIAAAAKDLAGAGTRHAGRQGFAPTSAKAMSDAWLELKYGWLPLLQDTKDAAEFLAHQLSVPAVLSYKVSRTLPLKISSQSPTNIAYGHTVGYTRGTLIARLSESPSLVTLLGLRNPLTLAWEILPWSFVVDWFLPIGDYLSARSFAGGLSGTFITSRKKEYSARGAIAQSTSPFRFLNESGSSYLYKNISFSRTINTSLVVPLPVVKPLAKVASWAHAENAIALLYGVLHRSTRGFSKVREYTE